MAILYMNNKNLIVIIIIIFAILICFFINSNTGLRGLEKEVSNFVLPDNIERIAMKSGIGDSGGNGDYSTYRVVLVVKTEMTIDELNQEFESKNLTFSSHIVNSNTPICYITHCQNKVFKSSRDFKLIFDELDEIEDFSNYYFIEFIK